MSTCGVTRVAIIMVDVGTILKVLFVSHAVYFVDGEYWRPDLPKVR